MRKKPFETIRPKRIYQLDQWQIDFLACETDKIACAGRQTGKSFITSWDCGEYAVTHSNETILMIAPVERESYELFDKTLAYLIDNHPKEIKKGLEKPTKHQINLTNTTKILCYPTGQTGVGIRGFTIHRLYVEEAARVPDEVWSAVTPMLLTTGGKIILISSAFTSEGYFYDCWINKNNAFTSFTRFTVNAEEIANTRPICATWTEKQKAESIAHLARERATMTKSHYAQEYLCQFSLKNSRFFSDELISKVMVLRRISEIPSKCVPDGSPGNTKRYGGVDIARLGEDESAFTVLDRISKNPMRIEQRELAITTKTRLTDTIDKIKILDKVWHQEKIGIDSGGVGGGVFDVLLRDSSINGKIISMENATRSLDKEDKAHKKTDKEVYYRNFLWLMENGAIKLFNEPEIELSLKSIQFEYKENGDIEIWGSYSHVTEALVRAAWLAFQDKSLNMWVATNSQRY